MFPHHDPRPSARSPISRADYNRQTVTPIATPAPILLFADLADLDTRFQSFLHYAATHLRYRADSCRGYKSAYGNFRAYLAADPRPLPGKLCDIDGWIAWNEERRTTSGKRLSDVSVNTYFRQLRPFFADLEARDDLPNPFRGIRPPSVQERLPKARSFEECQHVLKTAEHIEWGSPFERFRAVAILATFLYAGLRKGELLRLSWHDVDLQEDHILVTDTKTNAQRMVAIAPDLYPVLDRYIRERKRIFGQDAGAGFFTSLVTGDGISEATLRRLVSRVRRSSGIPFSIHSLRHSFVTAFLNAGGQLHVVQMAAGHKKLSTTAGYIRLTNEDVRREMQKLSFRTRATRNH
jgi:site-specific recombinase XerD